MGGGDGVLFPDGQPWEEVCATVSTTLANMTISGGRLTDNPEDPASAAAAVAGILTRLSQQMHDEAERLHAVLSDPKSEHCLAAFRAVVPVLGEAKARVAEADVVVTSRRLLDEESWLWYSHPLISSVACAATSLGKCLDLAAAEDAVRVEALATIRKRANGFFDWAPPFDSYAVLRVRRDERGRGLLMVMRAIGTVAAEAANRLMQLAQQELAAAAPACYSSKRMPSS